MAAEGSREDTNATMIVSMYTDVFRLDVVNRICV